MRLGAKPLTKRDAAAPHFASVLTLEEPRNENVLQGVAPPSAVLPPGSIENDTASELQRGIAQQVCRYPDPAPNWDHKPIEYQQWDSGDELMQWVADRWDRYRHDKASR